MQQQQGGDSGQYGVLQPLEMTFFSSTAAADPLTNIHLQSGEQHLPMGDPSLTDVAEAASPISSRPPVVGYLSAAGNFEEFLPTGGVGTSHHNDEDALGGDDADRRGGDSGGGGIAGGHRWPREETLALLKIRSEMDAAFRDATLKGPLWEDVSRKLAELGYKRSAKKCKEKFENVHKYYKRTKEGRSGRQDGKSYRFFSQLEALHGTGTYGGAVVTTSPSMLNPSPSVAATAATSLPVIASTIPVSSGIRVANPMPLSSVRMPSQNTMPLSHAQVQVQAPPPPPSVGTLLPHLGGSGTTAAAGGLISGSAADPAVPPRSVPIGGISFTSDSSSTYSGSDEFDEDEDNGMDIEGREHLNPISDRKRKRVSSSGHGSGGSSRSRERMMEFLEGLMKQVMRKQNEMQQSFLEAIEKREQDRMIREEVWKRQEMARLAREHELMAQERSMSAARVAALIPFIEKITGQAIQLPSAADLVPAAPPPPPQPPISIQQPPQPAPQPPVQSSSSSQQHHYQKPQEVHQPQKQLEEKHNASSLKGTEIVMAVPEQHIPLTGVSPETISSRWPKAEVLALINLRSGLEARYQEAGPKGPLWEEISVGMMQLGYKRKAKRCKEKWENINKYFKKVKESNQKRPEDTKTCPYFHQLDELYRKKIIGGNGAGASKSGIGNINQSGLEQQHQQQPQQQSVTLLEYPNTQENKNGGNTDLQTNNGNRIDTRGQKTPEDIMKEQHHQNPQQNLLDYGKIQAPDSNNLDQAEDEEDYEDDVDDDDGEETEEEMKMAYKIEFQIQNTGSSNGGGNGASSFLAMVQ